jgi:hypothetical protein
MRDDIVEKLHKLLEGPVASEPEVVYLLCQVRKLLDKYPVDGAVTSLKFYCHWALHIDLKYANWVLPFLKPLDEYLVSHHYRKHHFTPGPEFEALEQLLLLQSFRSQLKKTLKGYGLPHTICTNPKRWYSFIQAYANVVNDGNLMYSGDKLELVEKITFKALEVALPKAWNLNESLIITWTVSFKNTNRNMDFMFSYEKTGNHRIYIHPGKSRDKSPLPPPSAPQTPPPPHG